MNDEHFADWMVFGAFALWFLLDYLGSQFHQNVED